MAGTGTEAGTGAGSPPSLSHNPRGSLLELAYKLQMAHQRVFGFSLEKSQQHQFRHHHRHHRGVLGPTTGLCIKTEPHAWEQHVPSRPHCEHQKTAEPKVIWEKANDNLAAPVRAGHGHIPTDFAASGMTLTHIKTESDAELGYNDGGPLEDADHKGDTLKSSTRSTAGIHTTSEFGGTLVPKVEGKDPGLIKSCSSGDKEEDDCGSDGYDDQSFEYGTHTIETVTISTGGVPRKYKCSDCDYQTDNRAHFTRHEAGVHSLIKPYYCPVCQAEFSRTEKARAHMMKRHPEVHYDARMIKRDQPTSPGRVIADSPPPKLARGKGRAQGGSGQDFGTGFELACDESPDKTVSVHTSSKSKEKRFVCSNSGCSYRARDIWHLRRHVGDVHNRIKSYKCPACTYATSRKHRLVSHMKAHGRLYCFHCKFSTNNVKKFNLHVQICSLVARNEHLRCKRCGQGFVNRRNLKAHALKQHDVTLYCCNLCMFWSDSQNEYESHHDQHTKSASDTDRAPKPTVSLWENKSCKPRAKQPEPVQPKVETEPGEELPDSAYTRDEEGVLHCSFCKYQAKNRNGIREHLRKHCGEKMTCKVPKCSFKTSWARSLDLHTMAFHAAANEECDSGRGQFPCPYCPDKAAFVYKKSFDKHVNKHKKTASKCPMCKDAYIIPAELKLHLVGDHQVDDSDGEEVDEN